MQKTLWSHLKIVFYYYFMTFKHRNHSWSFVVTRGHSCVLLDKISRFKRKQTRENVCGLCLDANCCMRLWITFVFVSNTCVSLDITKTSPGSRHAFILPLYCTIARMSSFPGQCERLSRRLVNYGFDDVGLSI